MLWGSPAPPREACSPIGQHALTGGSGLLSRGPPHRRSSPLLRAWLSPPSSPLRLLLAPRQGPGRYLCSPRCTWRKGGSCRPGRMEGGGHGAWQWYTVWGAWCMIWEVRCGVCAAWCVLWEAWFRGAPVQRGPAIPTAGGCRRLRSERPRLSRPLTVTNPYDFRTDRVQRLHALAACLGLVRASAPLWERKAELPPALAGA